MCMTPQVFIPTPMYKLIYARVLDSIRENWINERNDVQTLEGMSSVFSNERLDNATLNELRFDF